MFFMDDNHDIFSSAFGGRRMKMTPSEYVAKHFHFSIIRDPLALDFTDKIPVDNLMWGSDFPHSVGSFPKSQDFIESAFKGKEKLKQKVLLDNPARYFKLDLSKEITPTPAAA
jgi:hypothetical protein